MSARLRFTVLSLAACLYGFCANGQEVKDGFIILANGEYEYGSIQLDPTLNVYEECLFSLAAGKPYKKFTPEQVLGYGVINGTHFGTKEITIGGTQKKTFLKKETDDVTKLYSFQDNRFFLEKENFEELTKSNYQASLSEALKSCQSVLPSIKRTDFDPQEIRKLLIKYQRCTDPESASTPFKHFEFDVMAGAEFNNTTLHGEQARVGLNDISLVDKTLLCGGVNAIISFRKSKNLAFATGVYYYQQSFYAIVQSAAIDYSAIDKINLDYGELLIPITLQYSLFKKDKKLMPYVKAGVSIPIAVKSTLVWESEKEYASTVSFERYDLPQKLKQPPMPTLSAGTTFNLIGSIRNVLEIGYVYGRGELKNNSKSITVNSSRVVVLLGFRF